LPTTSKLLKTLVRAGILVSHRGAKGGYGLAGTDQRVSVARVIEAVDGPIAITSCLDPNGAECGIDSFCPARTNWQTINRAIRVALEAVSIDEMARTVPVAFLEAGMNGEEHPRAPARDPRHLTA
jgi:Rrf2 family protein